MKIKDGFVLEEVGNSYLAVAVGERADSFAGIVKMNGTGAFIWNLMNEKDVTREEILAEMLKVYEVDEATLLRDIIAFEAKLRENGIIE